MNTQQQEAIKHIVESIGYGISFSEAKELVELILRYSASSNTENV